MSDTGRLRSARDRTGLSREKVSATLGISAKTLERWEKGHPVKRYQLVRLADVYGVPVDELVDDGVAA